MIQLTKETKIKLLKAIKAGTFDGDQFPELCQELKKISIEIIDRADQVRKIEALTDEQLDENISSLEKKLKYNEDIN